MVEDHILNTTSGLVNRSYIDELWDMALSKTVAVLRTHIVSFIEPICLNAKILHSYIKLVWHFCFYWSFKVVLKF